MPDLTLTITNNQWTRVKAAFTAILGSEPTAADMQTWILGAIKAQVQQQEQQAEQIEAEVRAATTLTDEGW
jgi:hypothetical protein